MRRLGGGAGRRRERRYALETPAAGARRNPGLRPVRRPRARLAASLPGGVGAPPGGTTASCQELADDRWARFAPSTKARPDAGMRTPQQSAERRAGPRHGPVISGRSRRWARPRGEPPGAAYPHQRLSALCSPHFFRGAETDKGHPAPHANRAAQRWLFFWRARDEAKGERRTPLSPLPLAGEGKKERAAAHHFMLRRARDTRRPLVMVNQCLCRNPP